MAKRINEKFAYEDSGILKCRVGDSTLTVANHAPILTRIITIDDGQNAPVKKLEFRVLYKGKYEEALRITAADMLKKDPVELFDPHCQVTDERGMLRLYRQFLKEQCVIAPQVSVYRHLGWQLSDGERVYLNRQNSVTAAGLSDAFCVETKNAFKDYGFTRERDKGRFETLKKFFLLLPPERLHLVYAGLSYAFLTPLNALLREIDFEPSFSLYLVGKSQNFKTSFAKLLISFFGRLGRKTPPPLNFRATVSSIEYTLAMADSCLVLLDDRRPAGNPKDAHLMQEIEQAVSRMMGDRAGKSRMTADCDQRDAYTPRCGLIVTGEEAYSNTGESSVARSIAVEILPDDISEQVLREIQKNISHLSQIMSEYIQWIAQNWELIQDDAEELFDRFSEEETSADSRRLTENIAYLRMGAFYLCEWLCAKGLLTMEDAERHQNKARACFEELARQHEERISEERPLDLFIRAFQEMCADGRICIIPQRPDDTEGTAPVREVPAPLVTGWMRISGEEIMIPPTALYAAVRDFYLSAGQLLPASDKALWKQLLMSGVARPTKEGKAIHIFTIRNKSRRVLALSVKKLMLTEGHDT